MQGRDEAIRCVVADDHEALRRGVIAVLSSVDDITVVGEAGTDRQTISMCQRRRPDVLVLDLGLSEGDGLDVCATVAAQESAPAIVVYTGHDDPAAVARALDAGASGLVLKGSPLTDLQRAVRAADRGDRFVDAILAAGVFDRERGRDTPRLSSREHEVLQLLSTGLTTDAAAGSLFLSPATVQDYLESAMHKLDAHNRVHAVAVAVQAGLIEGPSCAEPVLVGR
jgi:DNA-binding NarL/FixJ family response regulator